MLQYMPTASIKISRVKNGIFKKIPANILLDSKIQKFYSGDIVDYVVCSGMITLSINKVKYLTFELNEDESKEFIIRESFDDFRFYVKIFVECLIYIVCILNSIEKDNDEIVLLFSLFIIVAIIRNIKDYYFFIEEVKN